MPQVTPTFRDFVKSISPSWFSTGFAEKIVYITTGMFADILGDAAVEAVKKRFPRAGNQFREDTLGMIGRERKIRRGVGEPSEAYVARLREHIVTRSRKGNPYAMLEQIYASFTGTTRFVVELVYPGTGLRFTLDTLGGITRDTIDVINEPSLDWVLFYRVDPVNYEDWWPQIPIEWNAAHCNGRLIVLGNAQLWDYPQPVPSWDAGVWAETQDTPVIVEI